MKRFEKGILVLSVFLSLCYSLPLLARSTSATSNIFLPAIDPAGYITVDGSQTIQPWRYHVGLFLNYGHRPLEVGIGGAAKQGIVNHLIMGDVFGSLGITDWLQLGVNAPVALYDNWTNPTTGVTERTLRLGDVRLEPKFRILDIDRHSVGIALIPYVLFPTGSGSRFVGNNSFAGGAKLVLDTNIKSRVNLSANLGYLMRNSFTIFSTTQDDAFTYGLGVKIKTVDWLDLVAEGYGSTNVNNFFKSQVESPLEVDGGLSFHLPVPEGLTVTTGGGVGLTNGYGTPGYRLFAGITYPNPKRVDLPLPPPPPVREEVVHLVKEKIVITKKVHFEFDKAIIRPISFRLLDAVADVLKKNPEIQKVRVEGHCDYKGSEKYNMKLSERRANAVKEYLTAHGIAGGRLIAVGYGKTRPIAPNNTPEGRAKNRRVEFIIVDQSGITPETSPSK